MADETGTTKPTRKPQPPKPGQTRPILEDMARLGAQEVFKATGFEPGSRWTFRLKPNGFPVEISFDRDLMTIEHEADYIQAPQAPGSARVSYSAGLDVIGGACTRWVFVCPVEGCEMRVSALYGGARLACHLCWGATYRSRRESPLRRKERRLHEIRAALGWGSAPIGSCGLRPSGMSWKRYELLFEEHVTLLASLNCNQSWRGARKRMEIRSPSLIWSTKISETSTKS